MSIRNFRFLLLLFALHLPSLALGDDKPLSPMSIPGATKVDAEELLQLVQEEPRLVVIDARISTDRNQGYIEDSISLPDISTDCDSLKKVAANKSAPLLFYCNGPKCGRSAKSVQKAVACQYTRLYWFRGGFEEWRAKGYPTIKVR